MRVLLAAVSVLLVTAAPAAADNPLLSGYSGPGGGDQAVLGSTLLPAPKPGGSLRMPAKTPAITPTPSPASGGGTSTTSTTSTTTTTGAAVAAPSGGSGTPSGGAGAGAGAAHPHAGAHAPAAASQASPAAASPVPTAEAPPPSVARASQGSGGAFPLSVGDLLGLLAGAGLLVAIARLTARLRTPGTAG